MASARRTLTRKSYLWRRSAAIVLAIGMALGIAIGMAGAQQGIQGEVVARVTITNAADLRRFLALGLDMLEFREKNDYFILTTKSQLTQLQSAGWQIRADEQQTALLRRPQPAAFLGGYHTVSETRTFLNKEAENHPTLAQVFTFGLSYEGRELAGIRLTNRQITGTKPTFFLMAAIHARELSTTELALRFVDYLLSHYGMDGDATWLLDDQQIIVVPAANPDGRLIAEQGYYQRKNTDPVGGGSCSNPPSVFDQTGVDLNRNADFKWNTTGTDPNPCSETYPGPFAASEPETIALQNLIRSLFVDQRGSNDADAAPITTTGVLVTLHSYGDLALYPWGWTTNAAPNQDALDKIAHQFAAYNGFTAEQATELYPTSGTTDDWSYGELGIASFTFEVGGFGYECGGFMPPYACLDSGNDGAFWPRNLPAFLHAARIARAPYALAQGPATESLTVSASISGLVRINALLSEQYSGGQVISGAEYYVDSAPWRGGVGHALAAQDSSFDGILENGVTNAPVPSGKHLIFVRAQDGDGNWGPARAAWVLVPTQLAWFPFISR